MLKSSARFALDENRNKVAHLGAFEVAPSFVHCLDYVGGVGVRESSSQPLDDLSGRGILIDGFTGHAAMMKPTLGGRQ